MRRRELLLGRALPIGGLGLLVGLEAQRAWGVVSGAGAGASTAQRLAAVNTALVLLYYAFLLAVYVVRLTPRDRDRRPLVAAASFAGSFLVMTIPLLPAAHRRDWLLGTSDVLASAGMFYALWSLLYLRRSFSILPQARRLVTGGPYSLTRNPLYLGEIVSSASVFLPTIGWAGALVLGATLVLQLVRIGAEERVLERAFGEEYAGYRRRVPRLLPRLPFAS